ncbi:MAG: hypothetical protein WCQ64_07765 [Acidobacteriota bacterium]
MTFLFVSAAPLPVYTTAQPGGAAVMSIDQAQAAGQPIFDCSGLQATSARLKAGLPVQNEWIRRTEEQLKAAREGVQQSKEALQELAFKTAKTSRCTSSRWCVSCRMRSRTRADIHRSRAPNGSRASTN